MIQLVAVDLDETLLRTDKTVSSFTLSTLRAVRARGVKLVYATARGHSAEKFISSALFDGYVRMNGALAYIGSQLVYRKTVPGSLAKGFLLACCHQGLKAAAEWEGNHYSNFDVSAEWSHGARYQISDFEHPPKQSEKLYALVRSEKEVAVLRASLPDALYLTVSRDGLAQVMHKQATKMNALKHLADCWGIPVQNIAAFGDDDNDLDMLAGCGMGIAMGNAVPAAQLKADAVCGTNNEDGVAHWIHQNILSGSTAQ